MAETSDTLLAQTIGKPTYEKLISKPRTADLVDRWLNASGKAKGPATKALAIAIGRVADKPELVSRIERELGDAFDLPPWESRKRQRSSARAAGHTETKKHAVAANHRRNGQRVAYEKPKGVNLALLAKGNDVAKYIKARQNSRH